MFHRNRIRIQVAADPGHSWCTPSLPLHVHYSLSFSLSQSQSLSVFLPRLEESAPPEPDPYPGSWPKAQLVHKTTAIKKFINYRRKKYKKHGLYLLKPSLKVVRSYLPPPYHVFSFKKSLWSQSFSLFLAWFFRRTFSLYRILTDLENYTGFICLKKKNII